MEAEVAKCAMLIARTLTDHQCQQRVPQRVTNIRRLTINLL